MAFKNFSIEEGRASDINTYLMRQMCITCTSGTRPTPITGMRIWETDTEREMVYDGSTWRLLNEKYIYVEKQNTEVISSNNSPQDDDELFASVRANTSYIMTCSLFAYTAATVVGGNDGMNFKATFSGPAGATMQWSSQTEHPSFSGTTNAGFMSINQMPSITSVPDIKTFGGTPRRYIFRAMLVVAGTAGTFRVRWSQSTSVATNLFVMGSDGNRPIYSTLKLERF